MPRCLLAAAPFLLLALRVHAQLSPDAGLASLQPAPDLEATLFAAEPDVVNPTCIDIDPRGRVWVCEGVNYRGKARPPHRKTGDRIVVLEDSDGDGRADRSRVFHEGLDLETPLGICYLDGRIYVSQSPRIFTFEVKPDGTAGEKRDFLVGFDGVNHDHGVHSLVLGPEGVFYGAFGNSGARVADRSGRAIATDGRPYHGGMVFRVGVDGTALEGLAHNFRNNYECALDSFGTIFQSDNDDDGNQWVRFVHVVAGGNYGFLGPTGRHWSSERKSHWHMEDPGVVPVLARTGAGSPTGLCVYEGDLLPERYRGMPIHCDAGPRVVQCFRVRPLGAGYHVPEVPLDERGRLTIDNLSRIVKPEVLLTSSDTWFRPSDVAVAPDGSLLVSDWYDPGVGGHGVGDLTRGRIYRLTPKGKPKAYRPPPFSLETDDGLAEALASPALASRSLAVLKLRELGSKTAGLLARLAASRHPVVRARALWLLGALDEGRDPVRAALRDPDPRFRILAVRCLKRHARGEFVERVRPLLADPDPLVRGVILSELRDVPGAAAVEAVAALARAYDGEDRFYLAAVGIASRGRENQVFRALSEGWQGRWSRPLGGLLWELRAPEAGPFLVGLLRDPRTAAANRAEIARALSEIAGESGALALAGLLGSDAPPGLQREAAALIAARLPSNWGFLCKRQELVAGAEALLGNPELALEGAQLAAAGRIAHLRHRLESIASDASTPVPLRAVAIEGLGAIDDPAAVPVLDRLARDGSPAISGDAIAALGRMRGADPAGALRVILLETVSPEARSACVKALGGSKSGALLLLRLAEEGQLPEGARALSTTVVHSSAYEDVRLIAAKVLPRPRVQGGKDLPPLSELAKRAGSSDRGRQAFFDENRGNCGRCHRVGRHGSDVGPDLSVIGTKFGKDALFEAVLSPSASIAHEYRVWILQTRSAGFVTGYLTSESGGEVTLRDANGKKLTFKVGDILARAPSDVSLMPEGLVGSMTAGDLVDIVEFLSQQKN